MPYYPGGGSGDEVHYRLNTKGEKLVIDYLNITIFDVQEMPIDLYLYFMREANIHTSGVQYVWAWLDTGQCRPAEL